MKNAATREGAAPLALIAAGGEGRRLGARSPKALVVCAGRSLLEWCLAAFAGSASFGAGAGRVIVAAHAAELPAFEAACEPARAQGLDVLVTTGGPSRSHSVAAALRAGLAAATTASEVTPQIALVHDAARIFTTAELIDRLHEGLAAEPTTIAGLLAARPSVDTVKLVGEDLVVSDTPPRRRVWAVQTPQAFRVAALEAALGLTAQVDDDALAGATDDASLVEARGDRVKVLEWTAPNGKITTADDLAAADAALSRTPLR